MDIRKLQRAIVDGLEDVKAQDIVVFNTEHLSPLFERVVIATGSSNRQTKALAASVRDAVRSAGFQIMRTEGEDNGEWIIVDCAAAVVHIMQPAIRQYYQLEEIWGEKPVAIKLKGVKTGLVKASEPIEAPDEDKVNVSEVKPRRASGPSTAAKKAATTAPTRQAAGKKAAAKKAAVKKAGAKKAASKKTEASKDASIKKVVVNAPVRKAAAKKAAVKKVAAKKAPSKSAPAKKAVVRKAAAKKAPARKTSARTAR